NYISYEPKQKKDLFNLSVRPGLNFGGLKLQNTSSSSKDVDFGNEFGFRFGIEAESILPFNKNKWSLILEPTFQYFKSEKKVENNVSGGILIGKVNYQSIDFPVGFRHYFFIN